MRNACMLSLLSSLVKWMNLIHWAIQQCYRTNNRSMFIFRFIEHKPSQLDLDRICKTGEKKAHRRGQEGFVVNGRCKWHLIGTSIIFLCYWSGTPLETNTVLNDKRQTTIYSINLCVWRWHTAFLCRCAHIRIFQNALLNLKWCLAASGLCQLHCGNTQSCHNVIQTAGNRCAATARATKKPVAGRWRLTQFHFNHHQ